MLLEAGAGPEEEGEGEAGLVEASSGSSASKLRLHDLGTERDEPLTTADRARAQRVASKPNNLQDVADGGFFLWDVKAIWAGAGQEVALAAVVGDKLDKKRRGGGEAKWRVSAAGRRRRRVPPASRRRSRRASEGR